METLKKVPLDIDQIAHLIVKDDLMNCQLIYGLGKLNISADHYLSHRSEALFMVLGYNTDEVPEPLWDAYFDFTRDMASASPDQQEKTLDELAAEILQKLNHMIANPTLYEKAGSNS